MQRPKNRKTARGIVVHDGKVLLIERWRLDAKTGELLHYFSIPGGGILPGETPEVAVVRELFEEASLVVRPQQLVAKQQLPTGAVHQYFVCDYLSGEPKLHPSAHEVQSPDNRSKPRWVSRKEFADVPLYKTYASMRGVIDGWFDGKLPTKPL